MEKRTVRNWLIFLLLCVVLVVPAALFSQAYYEDRDENRERMDYEIHVISNEVIADLLERFCEYDDIYGSCEFYAETAKCFKEQGGKESPEINAKFEYGESAISSLHGSYCQYSNRWGMDLVILAQTLFQRELMSAIIFKEWQNDSLMTDTVNAKRQEQIDAGWLRYSYLLNWIMDQTDIFTYFKIDDELKKEYPVWTAKIEESKMYDSVFLIDFHFWGAFILAIVLALILASMVVEHFELWLDRKGYWGLVYAILIPLLASIQLLVYRF